MRPTFVVCKVLTTDFVGDIVYISKINMDPIASGKKKSHYTRFQLPLRLAYAMTINKVNILKLLIITCDDQMFVFILVTRANI